MLITKFPASSGINESPFIAVSTSDGAPEIDTTWFSSTDCATEPTSASENSPAILLDTVKVTASLSTSATVTPLMPKATPQQTFPMELSPVPLFQLMVSDVL